MSALSARQQSDSLPPDHQKTTRQLCHAQLPPSVTLDKAKGVSMLDCAAAMTCAGKPGHAMEEYGNDAESDEVGLSVRRLQCTKSVLAIREATKNDATSTPESLIDYIVSLTTEKRASVCTEREMCQWVVTQLCDRIESGQQWVVFKTFTLLYHIAWRGSFTFVECLRHHEKYRLGFQHVVELIENTVQENPTGAPLPCSLAQAANAAPSCCASTRVKKWMLGGGSNSSSKSNATTAPSGGTCHALTEREKGFLLSNMAYIEALCDYRADHPGLDLNSGKLMTEDIAGGMVREDGNSGVWRELLEKTLELIKSIAACDPKALVCPLGIVTGTCRLRDAVLLNQIAARALAQLLHATIYSFQQSFSQLQLEINISSPTMPADGAADPSARAVVTEKTSSPSGSFLSPNSAGDYKKAMHSLIQSWYHAIYQYNRTMQVMKAYCIAADHLPHETVERASSSFHAISPSAIAEMQAKLHHIENTPDHCSIDAILRVVQHATSANGSGALQVSPTLTNDELLADEAVLRESISHLHKCNDNIPQHNNIWQHQVESVCDLFPKEEAAVLRDGFSDGLSGLCDGWRRIMNSALTAAEAALAACETSVLSRTQDMTIYGLSSDGSGHMDTAEVAALAKQSRKDGVPSYPDSLVPSALTGSSSVATTERQTRGHGTTTYIIRTATVGGAGTLSSSASSTTHDIIAVDPFAMSEASRNTESSIEALLQEDDVVVICNEACSCNDQLKLVDRFQLLKEAPLGQGSYGRVYRAWDEVVGCHLAAKELPLDMTKNHTVAVREALREYAVLTELSHPNIVKVVAFMVLPESARIFMEWMPSGSLQDVLRHHPRGMLRETVVRRYAKDVLSGLAFLHDRRVIHHDVKPGNMLLSADGVVKLTDFGTSLVLRANHHTIEESVVTGTVAYMAPECVHGTSSTASDIWALGCSIVEMISGVAPWRDEQTATTATQRDPVALFYKIGNLDNASHLERPHDHLKCRSDSDASFSPSSSSTTTAAADSSPSSLPRPSSLAPAHVSADMMDMLDLIFVTDYEKRPSAAELLKHRLFNDM